MADLRVGLVDDHPLFRKALAQVLLTGRSDREMEIIEAGTIAEFIDRLDAGAEIDLLMLDLGLPGLHGHMGLLSLRSAYPAIPVIVVSAQCVPPVPGRCLMLGAAGFIPKSGTIQQIQEAVRSVLAGERWFPPDVDLSVGSPGMRDALSRLCSLSRREIEVCLLLGKGLLNKQIAHVLNISEATIKAHVSNLLRKLQVTSRTQAVVMLQQLDGEAAGPCPSWSPEARGPERATAE